MELGVSGNGIFVVTTAESHVTPADRIVAGVHHDNAWDRPHICVKHC
jgi:hypothetical protein